MPLKSWEFEVDGRPVRAEIAWRVPWGQTRKRVYVGHRLVSGRVGRFNWARPQVVEMGPGRVLEVRYRPTPIGLDMACTARVDGQKLQWGERPVRVERRWRFDDRPGHHERWCGCLLGIALLVVIPLYFPVVFVALTVHRWSEWRFRRRLRRRGRVVEWPAVEAHLHGGGPGTLLFHWDGTGGVRTWWTQDDVRAVSPVPLPSGSEAMFPGRRDHPFFPWSSVHYLSEESGMGRLAVVPKAVVDRLGRSDKHEVWRSDYPRLSVLSTAQWIQGGQRAAAVRFTGLLGNTLAGSLPAVIAAVADADSDIRRWCRETVRLAGPAAADAVPILSRQLHFGPWDERWSVANALMCLGPAGVATVQAAARVGDPRISRVAKAACSATTPRPR